MAPIARRILIACAVVALGVFALVALADRAWVPPEPNPVDASTFDVAAIERTLRVPAQLEEIAARPLFSASRRPPPPAAPAPEVSAPAEPIQDAKVLGLFGRQGAWGAILSINGKVTRVGPGQKVGQWALVRVDGNNIVFDNGAGARTTLKFVHLPHASAPSAATSAEGEAPTGGAPAGKGQRSKPGSRPASPEK